MRNLQVWNLLAVHVPNPLPKTVFGSHFPRPAGRLIWSTIMFVAATGIGILFIRRPKRSNEPATWVQAFLGAMAVWVWFTLGYAVVPSEWIVFGNSYLNFDSSTFLLRRSQWATNLPPFDITRDKFVDAVAAVIYVVVLGVNIYLFAAWQKRKVVEPVAAAEGGEVQEPTAGILGRLRARREARVSAYGRPVTTSE
jgi:hypothetical protein